MPVDIGPCDFEDRHGMPLCTVHKSAGVIGEAYCSAIAARRAVSAGSRAPIGPGEVCSYCSIDARLHPVPIWRDKVDAFLAKRAATAPREVPGCGIVADKIAEMTAKHGPLTSITLGDRFR